MESQIDFASHVKYSEYWFKKTSIKQSRAEEICRIQFEKCYDKPNSIKIPKIFHFIWIGSNPQPKTFAECYYHQWKNAHPDFEIKIWGEEDIEKYEFTLSNIINDRSLNAGLRADALRLEILGLFGGIYVDTDMALVKPIHSLLDKINSSFFIGISHTEPFEVNNAIVGCTPSHILIKLLIQQLQVKFKQITEQRSKQLQVMQMMVTMDPSIKEKVEQAVKDLKKFNVIELSGPGFITRELFTYLNQHEDADILILPKQFYYPVSNSFKKQLTPENFLDFVNKSVTNDTQLSHVYGCHMWESNWVEKATNNL